MPNQPIAHCGYVGGEMSVNGASTMLGFVSQVIKNWCGRSYT